MTDLYVTRLVSDASWLFILVAVAIELRGRSGWPQLLQLAGASVVCLWIAADWILFGPVLGVLDFPWPNWAHLWARAQRYALVGATAAFAIGFFASRWQARSTRQAP